jgi:prepilin peptidase CpaA
LGPGAATVAAVTAGGVLALGFLVWRCGWLGGGDVKLIAALSLWAGPDTVSGLLLAIALSGGVLALLMRLATRIACLPIAVAVQVQAARLAPARLPAILRGASRDAAISLPYGVAVAGGGAWLVHHLAFA